MNEEEMSVTKGLVELKLLDKRINKTTNGGIYVAAVRGGDNITSELTSKDETDKNIKASKKSVEALIYRRDQIKRAIIISNASTYVVVGGITMSVAEAIEKKNSITYKKNLLMVMKQNHAHYVEKVETENSKLENSLKTLTEQLAQSGNEDDSIKKTVKAHREISEWKLFDPIDLKAVIEKLDEEIDRFESNVDLALSEVNAITLITV